MGGCNACWRAKCQGCALGCPLHNPHTPVAQEAHTQPGESEAAAQDVRMGGWSCPSCGTNSAGLEAARRAAYAKGVAAERARIRAAVDAWYIASAIGEGQDLLRVLTFIDETDHD